MEELEFVIATGNKGKVREMENILGRSGWKCIALSDLGFTLEDEETGRTFLDNARIKAREARRKTGRAVIADDSGLMVDALGGGPGVHTARYAGENCTSEDNMNKLLSALEGLPQEERTARFVSTIVCILPDGREIDTVGTTEGYIGFEKKGTNGFGYNPIFYRADGRSFGEIPDGERYEISHRGRALRKLEFKLNNIKRIQLK